MKSVIFTALLITSIACTSEKPKSDNTALDGRTFKIENYVGDKMEGTEMMIFKNGKVENDECTKWGFGNASYSLDNSGNFKYTLTSDTEGKMDWEGQVTGSAISGKMVWIKTGQDNIYYTFKGEEVKN